MSEFPDAHSEAESEKLSALPVLPAKYEIRRVLGQGAMALVLEAFDSLLQRTVAIKVQLLNNKNSDSALQERFILEAKTLLQLDDQNVVKMLGSGLAQDGQPYIVMEHLEGFSLTEEIGEGKTLNPSKFLSIFIQVSSGLDYVHRQGIVHRDLKPSNIFLAQDQNGVCVKLIDFGIARELEEEQSAVTLTKTAAVIGTPAYMSPEQCLGKAADLSSDIYALGCVMYEAITGFPPFKADSPLELIYKHVNADWEHLENLADSPQSKKLARLVDACLSKQAELRPTAAQLKLNLQRTRDEMTSSARLYYSKEKAKSKRDYIAKVVAVVLALSWISFAGINLLRQQQTKHTHETISAIKKVSKSDKELKLLKEAQAEYIRAERLVLQTHGPSERDRYMYQYEKAAKAYADRAEHSKQPDISEKVLLKLLKTGRKSSVAVQDVYKRLADYLGHVPGREKDAEDYYKKTLAMVSSDSKGDAADVGFSYAQFLIRNNRITEAQKALQEAIPKIQIDKLDIIEGTLQRGGYEKIKSPSAWAERTLGDVPAALLYVEIKGEKSKVAALQICNDAMAYLLSQDSLVCEDLMKTVKELLAKMEPDSSRDFQAELAHTKVLLAQIEEKKLAKEKK